MINIVLTASTGQLEKDLAQAIRITKNMGRDLQEFGKVATAAITVPIAAAATAFVASAMKMDEAMDSIRARTGKTGAEFQALAEDMKAVLGTVPASVEDVGDAIAELSVRTGAAGKPLQDLSRQFLELANLTKSEVAPLIAATEKAFEGFGIEVSKQPAALDALFRAFQASGVPVQKLSELITQFGPQLRAMGFSFEEAVGAIAAFEKGGVNTEKVMASFNIALKNFAKQGIEDTRGALLGAIEQIKFAATASEGTALAVKLFGKAGVEMAQNIREGKMEISKFIEAAAKGPDTIGKAAEATKSFSERMQELQGQVTKALEPIGSKLLDAFEKLQPAILGVIEKIADIVKWFADLDPMAQAVIAGMAGIAASIGPVSFALGGLLKGVASVVGVISGAGGLIGVGTALLPLLTGLAVAFAAIKITGFIQDLLDAKRRMKEFEKGVDDLAKELKDKFGIELERGGRSLEEYERDLIATKASAEKFKGEIAGLSPEMKKGTLIVDESKMGWDKYKVAIDLTGGVIKKVTPEMTALAEENKKLIESFQKSSAPMNAMAADFAKLEGAGVSFNDILKANQDQIVSATLKQIAHGKQLSDTAQRYADAALAIDSARKAEEQWAKDMDVVDKILTSMGPKQEELNRDWQDAAKRLEEMAKNAHNMTNEWDRFIKVHDPISRRFSSDVKEMTTNVEGLGDVVIGVSGAWDKLPPAVAHAGSSLKKFGDDSKSMGDVWKNQVSTIVTDFGKGVADIILEGGNLFKKLKDIAVEGGKSFVRTFIEGIFEPLKQGIGSIAQALGKSLMDALGGIFGGGGGGGGGIGGILSGLGGKILGSLKGIFTGGGVGGAIGDIAKSVGGIFTKGITGALSFLGPWGAAAAGAAAILTPVFKGLFTKSSIDKAIKEAARDLGGVEVGKDAMKQFLGEIGLDEKGLENIRKDIAVSPKFLVDVAFPLAEAQGKVEQFYAALKNIGTAWGTFDFSEAFKVGKLTGDFTELNKAFVEAFSKSQNLMAIMPDFADKLLAPAKSAEELAAETQAAADALKAAEDEIRGMGDAFIETGVMTDAFAAKIGELGGNMEIFQAAAELPGLRKMRDDFVDLKAEVDKLLPKQLTMNETFLQTGQISEEMAANIRKAGGDVEAFRKFADVKQARDSFDDLVKKFKETGVVSAELTAAIQKFGSEGVRNLQLTADNVDAVAVVVKNDLNNAFVAAGSTLSAELDKMQKNLTQSINFLTQAVIQSMNAMVKALSGLPEEAAAIMDQLQKDFAAFQATPVEVKFEADTSAVDQAISSINRQTATINVETRVRGSTAPAEVIGESGRYVIPPNPFDAAVNRLPSLQRGGFISATGPYMLHAGEEVKPAGGPGTSDITINNTIHVHGNADRTTQEQLRRALENNVAGIRQMIKEELGLRR